ncbi:MAG: hypothetical protein R3F43_05520 [bacterium]
MIIAVTLLRTAGEAAGHGAVEPEEPQRVAARALGDPDGDPGEEARPGDDVHEDAGAQDDADDGPVDPLQEDGDGQGLAEDVEDGAHGQQVEGGGEQGGCGREDARNH